MNALTTPKVFSSGVKAPPLISMQHVHKQYQNGTIALRDMSLEIEEGQFVSFLGPSGCGKSTALRMIAGLLRPSSGDISVNGKSPFEGGGNEKSVLSSKKRR